MAYFLKVILEYYIKYSAVSDTVCKNCIDYINKFLFDISIHASTKSLLV